MVSLFGETYATLAIHIGVAYAQIYFRFVYMDLPNWSCVCSNLLEVSARTGGCVVSTSGPKYRSQPSFCITMINQGASFPHDFDMTRLLGVCLAYKLLRTRRRTRRSVASELRYGFSVLRRTRLLRTFFSARSKRALIMEKFEAFLENATEKGSNGVPGAAMAVIDKHGIFSQYPYPWSTTYCYDRQIHLQVRQRLQWCRRRRSPAGIRPELLLSLVYQTYRINRRAPTRRAWPHRT